MNPEFQNQETKFDILGNLPREICYKILFYLKPNDIANSFACCKKWQDHINYNFIWRKLCRSVYNDSQEEPKSEIHQNFIEKYSTYWHGRFMYNRALRNNVESQNYQHVRIKINSRTSFRFIHMDDRMIIFATKFNFFIVNAVTGLVEKRIWFKNSFNFSAIKHDNYLIGLTGDGHWKVWNVENWMVVVDGYLHGIGLEESGIKVMCACKHLITIVTEDDEVFIVDIKTQDYIHLGPGISACCNNELIAVLEENGNLVIRDTDYKCVTTVNCPGVLEVKKMRMIEDYVVIDFITQYRNYRSLFTFNIKTKETYSTPTWIANFWPSAVQVSKNRIVFRSSESSVKVCDIRREKRFFEIAGEERIDGRLNVRNIFDLALHHSYIYISIVQIGWKVYSLETGKLVHDLDLPNVDSDVIATTKSRLLCKCFNRREAFWDIVNYEANLMLPT